MVEGRNIVEGLEGEAKSIGALHGSARGKRNVFLRLDAMKELGLRPGGNLLEVGCGTGEYTRQLAEQFDTVEAIDVEQDRLEVFKQDLPDNVVVFPMSVTDMSFSDESFDVVTMIEVLEHLPDPAAAIREIGRVLKPGGELYLTTPNRYWPLEQHGVKLFGKRFPSYALPGLVWCKPLHARISNCGAFTRKDVERLVEGSGMAVGGVTFMFPPLDSLPEGHMAHKVTERLDSSPMRAMGQTIIVKLVKKP